MHAVATRARPPLAFWNGTATDLAVAASEEHDGHMLARAVNHVSFPIRDLERSLAFYRDFLGLETIERPNFGFGGAWLGAGNAQIHLIVTPDGMEVDRPPPSLTPIASHLAFTIDDYAATLARARAHGLEVLETSPSAGQMWVRDPDGHVIELIAANARR